MESIEKENNTSGFRSIAMKVTLVLLAINMNFVWIQKSHAQDEITELDSISGFQPLNLALLAKFYGDSVVLRWAPKDPLFWKESNKAGYMIHRFTVDESISGKEPTKILLTESPVLPWSLETWQVRAEVGDTLAAMAVKILFEENLVETENMSMENILNMKIQQENLFGMALMLADNSPRIAEGLGLRLVDKEIEKGKVYVYTLHALVNNEYFKSDTAAVLVETQELLPPPVLPPITVEQLDKAVRFSWDRSLSEAFFSAYFIERSTDNGNSFQKISNVPIIQPEARNAELDNSMIFLTDSLPQNYFQYHYRIFGITPFGEAGAKSEILTVMGRDLTAPIPPDALLAENLPNNEVRINWTKNEFEPDFKGFLIGRSQNIEGPYIPLHDLLLEKNKNEFIDKEAIGHGTNYYVVAAIDTAGNSGLSVPAYVIMKDEAPPAMPIGLNGTIDSTGVVQLYWELGTEPDLMGYLVYYAHSPEHPFTPISEDFVADNSFADSIALQTLSKKIYYKIAAFDKNRNPSPYSEILELTKPDLVPPVPAVFSDYRSFSDRVYLSWIPSSSEDLDRQLLFRRENDNDWELIQTFEKEVEVFTDSTLVRGPQYEYGIVSVDDSGLESEMSFSLSVRLIDSGQRREIESFEIQLLEENGTIKLQWNYSETRDFYFVVYRNENDSGLLSYKLLEPEVRELEDNVLVQGQYEYGIKAVFDDGGESPMKRSQRVRVGIQ
ncbi:hypothetical protein [Aquiflexum sp.]|uniref:hypothetical protein n=1 Tax=Aquiflexum sp. TaxID=1872584 RepID=UPI0035934E33